MQRTVVFYAVAISTLAGALLLAPKILAPPPPEPPPPPPPAPTTQSAVTRLTYADAVLTVDARLDRGLLLRSGSGPAHDMYLDVALRAIDDASSRPPVAALLVIDRSGSMADRPIRDAKNAALSLLSRLSDGDRVALVSYATDATVDLPWMTLDADGRARAKRAIAELTEGGGTNIDGGLKRARSLLASLGSWDGVTRVLLLSDGQANEGEKRTDKLALHAKELRDRGAVVSAVGIGLEYNERLLERLAEDGRGRYHYLRNTAQLADILDDELEHATRVVARDVRFYVEDDPAGFTFVEAPGATVERNGGRTAIVVGDMAAGEERRVLLRLAPGEKATLSPAIAWLAPEVTYRRDDGQKLLAHRADAFRVLVTDDALALEQSRDEGVRARVLEVTSSVALTKSMEAYSEGDVATARRLLEDNRVTIERVAKKTKNVKLLDEAQVLGGVMETMQANSPSSATAQDLVKYQRARAFEQRR